MRRINSGHMNSARMATVTAVTFIVALAPLLWGLAEVKEPPTGDCSDKPEGAQVVSVDEPNTTVTLNCGEANKSDVKPKFDENKFMVCTDVDCGNEQLLSTYIVGATVEEVKEALAKVKIEKLPSEETTFYIQCQGKKDNACYIEVKVAKAPDKPATGRAGMPFVGE